MSCVSDRVVRTRYAVRASDPVSVQLPEDYAEEMRNAERQAEAARRRRQAYVQEVAGSYRSVAEVRLLERDGRTETMDFMRAYLRRDDGFYESLLAPRRRRGQRKAPRRAFFVQNH